MEDKFIKEIGLSIKPMNMLIRRGIYWVSDLVKVDSKKIEAIFPGIGEVYKKEIITKVHELGFVFKDEDGYAEQVIFMPKDLLDTPLAQLNDFRSYNYFFLRRNIITVRDLINIKKEDFESLPQDKQEFIISRLQLMKLNFAFKNENATKKEDDLADEALESNLDLIKNDVTKKRANNNKKKKLLKRIELLLTEFEALNEESKQIETELEKAYQKLRLLREKKHGK